jgi:hypothetical protein
MGGGGVSPGLRLGAATLAAAVALGGCAPTPLATNFGLQSQRKMQSAAHWRVLADEVAARVADEEVRAGLPVHVARLRGRTVFGDAFHAYLVAALAEREVPLSASEEDAVVLRYTTQVVAHAEGRRVWPTGALAGSAAAGAGAVAAVGDSVSLLDAAALAGGGVLLLDLALGAYDPATRTELIVGTTLAVEDIVLYAAADTFYVGDGDWRHYEPRPEAARAMLPPIYY